MLPEPALTFLGYCVKRVAGALPWLASTPVEMICSVSNHLSPEPEGRFKRWEFNDSGYYDTEELARRSIEPGEEESYTAFADAIFPLEFSTCGIEQVSLDTILNMDTARLPPSPLPHFEFIGFDVISGRRAIPAKKEYSPTMAFFDCSPLSCNMMATEYPVNRYSLLERWDDAVAAAERFGREEPEPGPYYIFFFPRCRGAQPNIGREAKVRGQKPEPRRE